MDRVFTLDELEKEKEKEFQLYELFDDCYWKAYYNEAIDVEQAEAKCRSLVDGIESLSQIEKGFHS